MKTKIPPYIPFPTNFFDSPIWYEMRMINDKDILKVYMFLMARLASNYERKINLIYVDEFTYDLRVDRQTVLNVISSFFQTSDDSDYFWSDELNESLAGYDKYYENKSKAGKASSNKLTDEEKINRARKGGLGKGKKDDI